MERNNFPNSCQCPPLCEHSVRFLSLYLFYEVCFTDDNIVFGTASLFWNKIILEAWYQIISGRFVHCVYDEDDYLRFGLNYAVFRFKILIDKHLHNS